MNLLIDYFTSPNIQRRSEYIAAIHENIGNPLIRKVFIFTDEEQSLNFMHEDIEIVNRPRPTFEELFRFCNERLKGEICIIANTDIIFDETLEVITKTDMTDLFVALTRHDLVWDNGEWKRSLYLSAVSQDAWIFKAPIRVPHEAKFHIGDHGSDNRLARLMSDEGYSVRNPAEEIIATHLHLSGYRVIETKPFLSGPYMAMFPNDDITKPPKSLKFDSFNHLGQPS